MDDVASRLVTSIEGFLIPLRTGQGFSVANYEALCDSLMAFQSAWATSETIPKEIVSAFIDLLAIVESCQSLYQGDDRKRIAQAGGQLFDRVQAICTSEQSEAPGEK